jgi:glutathione peroxidase
MFTKVKVKGDDKDDVYKFLIQNTPGLGDEVKWNFEKFLVDRNGKVVDRFRSLTKPESLESDIKKLL